MLKPRFIRQISWILLVSGLLTLATPAPVYAGIVTTSELLHAQHIQQERDRLQRLLDRKDVREALRYEGVNADAAKERVANMTDQEVQTLALKMDKLPAGGRLSNLDVVLLVLLIVILV